MHFEGIVIHRVPYKERDLIVKLLLRNGLVGSFYIYGGQGGGKNHKPSIFELGSMMKIMTKDQRAKIDASDLFISAEHQRIWEPQNLRYDVRAFYLVCLYFELIQKFSMPYQVGSSDYSNDHEGVFSVVSNALFYIEDSLVKKQFSPHQQLTLFLVKLLFHLGIMPDTDLCSYCQSGLLEKDSVMFLPANGQFACQQCAPADTNEKGFLLRIKKGYQTRYQEYDSFLGTNFSECDKLIQYFCHQFHLRPVELKSYGLLFK